MGGKVQEFSFSSTSAERLWQACIQSVGLLGYTVMHSDSSAKSVSFNTGRSMSSWAGQDLNATVISRGSDSHLVMGGSLATRGNLFGGGSQVVSWGEKGQLIKAFVAKVAAVLPSVAEAPAAPPVDGQASDVASRIKELAALHAEGLVTDAEFSAKKQELLDRM